jgi:hypothetical protein
MGNIYNSIKTGSIQETFLAVNYQTSHNLGGAGGKYF